MSPFAPCDTTSQGHSAVVTYHGPAAQGTTRMKFRLRHHLSIVIAVKIAAIFLLWLLFFSPSHRVPVDPDRVDQKLFSSPSAEESRHGT